jgi:hypothetical protein
VFLHRGLAFRSYGVTPTYRAENLSSSSIAFPLRLQQGLLQKTDDQGAYLTLLEIMARTPRGSWHGHPLFGFHEFFAEVTKEGLSPESRIRIAEKAANEINTVLADLGLTRYRVDSLLPDALEPTMRDADRTRWTNHLTERRGVTLMLRENGSDRATGHTL